MKGAVVSYYPEAPAPIFPNHAADIKINDDEVHNLLKRVIDAGALILDCFDNLVN